MRRVIFDDFADHRKRLLWLCVVDGFGDGEFELSFVFGESVIEPFFEEWDEICAARFHGLEAFVCDDVVGVESESRFESGDFAVGDVGLSGELVGDESRHIVEEDGEIAIARILSALGEERRQLGIEPASVLRQNEHIGDARRFGREG